MLYLSNLKTQNLHLLFFSKSLLKKFPKLIINVQIIRNHITIVTDKLYLLSLLKILKYHTFCQFKILIDITAVDYLSHVFRFEIIYQLISVLFNFRITLKLKLKKLEFVDSASLIYNSAFWLEREVWDLFGIFFAYHTDLRRILTDYGFIGFPLRKDFPLTGFVEIVYSDEFKRVIYKPLQLTQEFRFFDFQSPWYNINK